MWSLFPEESYNGISSSIDQADFKLVRERNLLDNNSKAFPGGSEDLLRRLDSSKQSWKNHNFEKSLIFPDSFLIKSLKKCVTKAVYMGWLFDWTCSRFTHLRSLTQTSAVLWVSTNEFSKKCTKILFIRYKKTLS